MIRIELDHRELMMAGQVGLMRRIKSISKGYDKNKHAVKSDWQTDIDGAAAEMAVAKWLGIYWGGHEGTFKAPDVGPYHVRSTTHANGHLLIRPDDDANDICFLVITDPPIYSIIGSLRAGAGMLDVYWRPADTKGGGAWWVPQGKIDPIEAMAA